MARPQTTQQFRKLNTLESVIVGAEDSADDAHYQQASIVVAMLDAGQTQRQIAAGWINGRTGKPYAHDTVGTVARIWKRFGRLTVQDRPDWATARYTVAQGADDLIEPEQRQKEWTQAHEARAPKSEETAQKLVQNLLRGASDVVDIVHRGLAEGRTGIRSGNRTGQDPYVDRTEANRRNKEADAFAKRTGEPILNAFSKFEVVVMLEQALESLREMTALESDAYDHIKRLLDELSTEAEVKRAMAGIR